MLHRIDNLLEWTPDPNWNDPVTILEAMGVNPANPSGAERLAAEMLAYGKSLSELIVDFPRTVLGDWGNAKDLMRDWARELGIKAPKVGGPRPFEVKANLIENFPSNPSVDHLIALFALKPSRMEFDEAMGRTGVKPVPYSGGQWYRGHNRDLEIGILEMDTPIFRVIRNMNQSGEEEFRREPEVGIQGFSGLNRSDYEFLHDALYGRF